MERQGSSGVIRRGFWVFLEVVLRVSHGLCLECLAHGQAMS